MRRFSGLRLHVAYPGTLGITTDKGQQNNYPLVLDAPTESYEIMLQRWQTGVYEVDAPPPTESQGMIQGFPVIVVLTGGIPATQIYGPPAPGPDAPVATVSANGYGLKITLVEDGGIPLILYNRDGTQYSGPFDVYPYVNPEAKAVVSRMTVKPSDERKGLIDDLVGGMKSAGVWTKLDLFYMTAAHDAQAARVNWMSPNYALTAINSPSFITDRGYAGDGATSYLDTGFNPSTAPTPKFTLNSASMGLGSSTSVPNTFTGTNQISFEFGNGNAYISRAANSANASGRVNSGSALGNMIPAAFPGDMGWSRSGAALWEAYVNGADVGGGVDASATVPNANFRLCSIGGTQYGQNRNWHAYVGNDITAGEQAAFYAARLAYKTAVGVP